MGVFFLVLLLFIATTVVLIVSLIPIGLLYFFGGELTPLRSGFLGAAAVWLVAVVLTYHFPLFNPLTVRQAMNEAMLFAGFAFFVVSCSHLGLVRLINRG